MSEILEFSAELRQNIGKNSARFYRNQGKIPAVIYGLGKETIKLAVNEAPLTIAYNKPGLKSKLINININNEIKEVIVSDVQVHPVTDKIEHADFIYADKKIASKMLIDLKYINFDKSVGIKRGGKINIILRNIYLLCLAKNAPRFIEVDISKLNIGDKVRENDLLLPAGVRLFGETNRTIVTLNGKNKTETDTSEEPNNTK